MNAAAYRLRIERAIRRRAEVRGDKPADTAALVIEAWAQPDHALPDLVEHFEAEAQRWERATGQPSAYTVHQLPARRGRS